MADFNIPTQDSLNDLYGSWNPMSYIKGRENQGLADQYRMQAQRQAEEATRKATLDNIFTEQDNPNRVQERVLSNQYKTLQNEGQGYLNTTNRLGAERAQANQTNLLNEDQRKAALSLTEDEMKAFDNHVGQLLRAGDPRGVELQKLIPAFQAERRKATDELERQRVQSNASIRGHELSLEGVKYSADKRLESSKARADKGTVSIEEKVRSGKMTFEQATAAFLGAAQFEEDPDIADKYRTLAAQYEQLGRNKAEAAGQGKLDLTGATGMAVKNNPPVVPAVRGGPMQPAAPAKAQHSLADVRKLYPGVPDDKLREAYKKRFNQDLQ